MKRLIKTPKLYFCDTGLLAYLSMWTSKDTLMNGAASGHFFENYVANELTCAGINLFYWKGKRNAEFEFVVQRVDMLSEVQDNFERAFASENKAQDLEAFEKGMQMIYNQFAKILTDAGLEQIDPTGAEFDPNMHEALMQQPSETVPEGHVVTVFQKGYKLKNKILKTAKVIVSSGK